MIHDDRLDETSDGEGRHTGMERPEVPATAVANGPNSRAVAGPSGARATAVADGPGRHLGLPLRDVPGLVGADPCVCPATTHSAPMSRPIPLPRLVQWIETMPTNDCLYGVKRHGLLDELNEVLAA